MSKEKKTPAVEAKPVEQPKQEEKKVLYGLYAKEVIKEEKMKDIKKQCKTLGDGFSGYNVSIDKNGDYVCKKDAPFCCIFNDTTVTVMKSSNIAIATKLSEDIGRPAINGQTECFLPPEDYLYSVNTAH